MLSIMNAIITVIKDVEEVYRILVFELASNSNHTTIIMIVYIFKIFRM